MRLINAFAKPYDNSVATARTCYSPKVIYPEDVSATAKARALRDRIAQSTFEAGHHTTIQHPTFQFVLERVSRQFIWSFLHSHPYYNSEQVSQRYVRVAPGHWTIPDLPNDEARELFEASCRRLAADYEELCQVLLAPAAEVYFKTFPKRRRDDKRWLAAVEKRAFENARYVLPVATHAHLYHTISGLTLHRYRRLIETGDTPAEQRAVVGSMIAAVEAQDPDFFKTCEDPMRLEDSLEAQLFERFHRPSPSLSAAFIREFDAELDGKFSVLTDYKINAEASLAKAVRSVLALPREALSDEAAIAMALDPAQNPGLTGALNTQAHQKLTRAMVHPHFSFRKVLSHSADSQDQRHRMVPGSRPILAAQLEHGEVDVISPRLISEHEPSRRLFEASVGRAFAAVRRLRELGASPESANYLLPNATKVRFEESGDLLNLRHKWGSRLCYLAQEEIFQATRDEVLAVRAVAPKIAELIGPPCWARHRAGLKPYCPEGDRFCGVRVWELDLEDYDRY